MTQGPVSFAIEKAFDYENGFYLTAGVNRFSKFVTHLDLYRRISGLPGEVVECGVFKGASLCRLIKLRALLENAFSRRVVGFDTFGAFPAAEYEQDKAIRERFVAEAGEHSISVDTLKALLGAHGLLQNVELVAGDLRSTLPEYVQARPQLRVALLHVDVDLYEPTRTVLEQLYPHVVPGGIVILDDYGAFPGANKAIDEYFAGSGLTLKKFGYTNAISFIEKPAY